MADLTRSISIFLDGSKLQSGATQAQATLDALIVKLNKLESAGDTTSKEFTQTKKAIDSQTAALETYKAKVVATERVLNNLSGATLRELDAVIKSVKNDLKDMERGTESYKDKVALLNRVEKERTLAYDELNSKVGAHSSIMSKAADGFNKYFNMGLAAVGAITGLSLAFRKLAEDVAHMDDVYSDVMKTTGMTKEEVLDLNETLKTMDTRTGREELNKLAEEAGKLGLSGKKDILDFVDAGNQIKVALGEDLGEDAIKNIGKMVGVFRSSTKELQGIGLKEQMLSVGSAINELGASSSASEQYLVDFAGRLGGVSKQANIGMDSILGYASALDQDMQSVEMSATAFQQFIQKLMGDPAKFARLAGLEVSQFSQLLKTDANAAIKQVLGGLNDKGGFQALIPIFQDMGMDGSRAVGVLSAMAGSIDKIDQAQAVANKSMSEGLSITAEYEIKNNNLAAKLDKAKKQFQEQALMLGEALSPALLTSVNATTLLIKALTDLPKFLKDHAVAITTLTIVITALTIAEYGEIAAKKLQVFWDEKIIASMKKVWSTISANPWKTLAAVTLVAAAAVLDYIKNQNKAGEAAKKFNQQFGEEKAAVDRLFESLKKTNMGSAERSRLISEINEKYGEYLPNLLSDKTANDELDVSQRKVINGLKEKIGLQIQQTAIDSVMKDSIAEQLEAMDEIYKNIRIKSGKDKAEATRSELAKIFDENGENVDKAAKEAKALLGKQKFNPTAFVELNRYISSLRSMYSDIASIEKKFESIGIGIPATVDPNGPKEGDKQTIHGVPCTYKGGKWVEDKVVTLDPDPDAQNKAQEEALKKLSDANETAITLLKKRRNEELDVEDNFDKLMLAQKLAYLKTRLSLEEKFKMNTNSTQQEIYDTEKTLDEKLTADKKAQNKKEKDLMQTGIQMFIDGEKTKVEAGEKAISQSIDNLEKGEEAKNKIIAADIARQQKVSQVYGDAIASFGGMLGEFMTNQEMTTQDFMKQMVLLMLDVLEKIVLMSVASAAVQSMSSTESVATWGVAGVAKTAIIEGLIMGAFAGVKAAVNNGWDTGNKKGYKKGGFTPNVGVDTVVGDAHGGEFIGSAPTVLNPAIKRMYQVVDYAQKTNTVNSITPKVLARAVGVRTEMPASNGFGGITSANAAGSFDFNYLTSVLHRMDKRADKPVYAYYLGKGSVSEAQDLVSKLKNNSKRKP